MSYAMTHLIIADTFSEKRTVHNKELFMLGSLSPDAVHSRPDFTFRMKADSHNMQPDEKWGQIYKQEAMNIWYGRLADFYKSHLEYAKNENEVSFLQGYVNHMLVDIFNCKLLYAPNLIKYDFQVELMRDDYRKECIEQDNYLYQNYERSSVIMDMLNKAAMGSGVDEILSDLKLDCFISAENIRGSIDFNLGGYRKAKPAGFEGLKMVSEQGSKDYLETVSAETLRMLYEFPPVGETFRM